MKWIIRPEAVREADDAISFYESRQPGLGMDFLLELERAYHIIRQAPQRWAPFAGEARRYLVRRFRYTIIYTIHQDTVFVLAVMHQSRQPDYWRDRMP